MLALTAIPQGLDFEDAAYFDTAERFEALQAELERRRQLVEIDD